MKKFSDEKKPTSLSSPPAFSRPPITLPTAAPTTTTTDAPPRVPPPTESSRRDLLAKLAERRRTAAQEARAERPAAPEATPKRPNFESSENIPDDDNDQSLQSLTTNPPSGSGSSPGSRLKALLGSRSRFNLNRGLNRPKTTEAPQTTTRVSATRNILRGRDRFRNLLSRTSTVPPSLASSEQ
jgi:hypothetical protein